VYEPSDPTWGELPAGERRALVRRVTEMTGRRVSARVEAAADAGHPLSEAAEKVAASTEIQQALRTENERRVRAGGEPLSDGTVVVLHDMVLAHIYGLGELEELWNNDEVENIDANGFENVFVQFAGGITKRWTPIASSSEEFLDLIRRVARRLGLVEVQFDARHPKLDLQLPDGSRMFAVYGGPGTNGVGVETYLCIRRHRFLEPTADDLVRMGLWPQQASDFVVRCLAAGENVFISGDWSAGKTTALRAIIYSAVQPWERVITVEAAITELRLHKSSRLSNVVALFSRPPGTEGEGEVSVWELIEEYTRRLNGSRLIAGEVLGKEVGPVLDAFTSSTHGSACTIHARSARAVVGRFEQYGLAAVPPLPAEAVRVAFANSLPIIVHLALDVLGDGTVRRYCTSVTEVTGLEDGHVAMTELWGLDDTGHLVAQHVPSAERRRRLARSGWEWTVDGWADQLPDREAR
jgi:Flp pilus assembly CpaF family ATPase